VVAVAANRERRAAALQDPGPGRTTPVLLVKDYSIDPSSGPSGEFLVYRVADGARRFRSKRVGADGTARAASQPDPHVAAPGAWPSLAGERRWW
jgi:hypothetical protein